MSAALAPVSIRSGWTQSKNLTDHPTPRGREEAWRFTPLRHFKPLFDEAVSAAELAVNWESAGAQVELLQQPVDLDHTRIAPEDRTSALALNQSRQQIHITVPPETTDATVHVRIHGDAASDDRQVSLGHIRVELGHHATAAVVLEYSGHAVHSDNVEIIAGDESELRIATLHAWEESAVHAVHHDVFAGRNAQVQHIAATFGARALRLTATAHYDGPGSEIELLGVSFTDENQHHEHRLFVDHTANNCRSNVVYKSALQGEGAHTVWIGDVLIRDTAHGTDTYEINRNLVLTRGTRTDSVPNLEIETGEVAGAGHASTTGRFDEEHLFYLMSRGISEAEAKRLVVAGFFRDIVDMVQIPAVTAYVERELELELDRGL